jgi:hypothetical protein
MPIIRVQLRGLKEVQAEMGDMHANQVPFATALAMTRTAQQGQSLIRSEVLPARFTLRRAPWMKQNVRITPATKAKLEASVQDTYAAMELQETGGTKIPYGSSIAVPLSGARPRPNALVADEDRPHAVMQRGGFIRNGIMYAVALKHTGARRKLNRNIAGIASTGSWERKIVPMYALVPRAVIHQRYGFEQAVLKVIEANFKNNFHDAFLRAVRTARK